MNQPSQPMHTFTSVALAAVIVATVAGITWLLVGEPGNTPPPATAMSTPRPDDAVWAAPVASAETATMSAWQLAYGLDTTLINDLLPDAQGGGVWLATDRGLAHVDARGRTRKYPHFSSAEERVRRLVRTRDGMGMTLMWPQAGGSGNRGATVLFDPQADTHRQVGPYLRALVAHEGDLYGVAERTLLRVDAAAGSRMSAAVKPAVDVCRVVQVISADRALWLAHHGQFRRGPAPSDDDPCGVVRLRPRVDVQSWDADNGLVSGHARAIVADARAVYVAYGANVNGLSVYDLESKQWRLLGGSQDLPLAANVLGLSPTTVWLGTPDAKRPLVWVNRVSGASGVVAGIPDNHVVSALVATDDSAWVAFSAKEIDGSGYAITTWLARVRDPNAADR